MKLLFVLGGLISSSTCLAARYAVVFKDTQAFNQVHSQWTLNSSVQLQKLLFSQSSSQPASQSFTQSSIQSSILCDLKVEKSLSHLQTVVIAVSDEDSQSSCLTQHLSHQMSHATDTFQLEKEVIHPTPRLQGRYELTPAWKFDITTVSSLAAGGNFSQQSLPWGVAAVKAPEVWSMGRFGHGSRVMVLDTGVDQNHPVLQGQIEEMKDFVNDGNTPYPAADHIGHGTHVSGTILGRQASSGFSGVAPQAKLLMGRVCSENGCSSMDVIEGVNWAIEKKVDVLSLSLGSDQQTTVENAAMAKAEAAGVIVVAASGNGGTPNVGFPAAYASVLAVGAVDSELSKAPFSQWGPELGVVAPGVDVLSSVPVGTGCNAEIQLSSGSSQEQTIKARCFSGSALLKDLKKDLLDAGLGKPADFEGQDFTGHLALITRGEIPFTQKVANALSAHAAGVVFINNQKGLISGVATDDGSTLNVPVVMIEQTTGGALRDQVKAHSAVNFSLNTTAVDYASFDGTSMACPHVAGIMALVREAHPAITPSQARDLLKRTAKPLPLPEQTGSGMVDAQKAVTQALQMK